MPFSGGVFTRLYSWRADRNASIPIDSTRMDSEDDGFAAGLSTAICRDGQSTVIANIPFSGNKITGLGDAAADLDALNRRSSDARNVRQVGGAITPANSASSTLDLSTGRYFYVTATGAQTWAFNNPASTGNLDGFILELTNGGLGVQTWPAGTT